MQNGLVAFVDGLQFNHKYIIIKSSIKRARDTFGKETAQTSKMSFSEKKLCDNTLGF